MGSETSCWTALLLDGELLLRQVLYAILTHCYLTKLFQNNVTSPKVTISDVFRSFMVSSILSLLVLPLTATIFTVSWFFLPVLHKIPFVSLLLTPFTAHFLRASLSIFLPLRHFDLLRRALHLGFVSLFVWDIVDTLFDNNVAKVIS